VGLLYAGPDFLVLEQDVGGEGPLPLLQELDAGLHVLYGLALEGPQFPVKPHAVVLEVIAVQSITVEAGKRLTLGRGFGGLLPGFADGLLDLEGLERRDEAVLDCGVEFVNKLF
jgi:hypothetical protein